MVQNFQPIVEIKQTFLKLHWYIMMILFFSLKVQQETRNLDEKKASKQGEKELRVLMEIGNVPSQISKTNSGTGFKVLKFKYAYL